MVATARTVRGGRPAARTPFRLLVISATAVALSACTAPQRVAGDDAVYDEARDVNLTFKRSVADVQASVLGSEWKVGEYGDVPVSCDDGYGFRMTRTTPSPAGWRLPAGIERMAHEIGERLAADGWSDVEVVTYEEGLGHVLVQARRTVDGVARLDVDLATGEVADGVIVRAESTCHDGDPNALMAELYPGWPTEQTEGEAPTTERPDADPVFGFTAEGRPR